MRWRVLAISALLWAAGMSAVWWLAPGVPRAWQPPADETICGFLSDSRTLATRKAHFSPDEKIPDEIHLWDIESGTLRPDHPDKDASLSFPSVRSTPVGELLQDMQHTSGYSPGVLPFLPPRHGPDKFRLRLLDPQSSREVRSFDFQSRQSNVWWVFTSDGRITAFDILDKHGPRVEWHDVATGRLVEVPDATKVGEPSNDH